MKEILKSTLWLLAATWSMTSEAHFACSTPNSYIRVYLNASYVSIYVYTNVWQYLLLRALLVSMHEYNAMVEQDSWRLDAAISTHDISTWEQYVYIMMNSIAVLHVDYLVATKTLDYNVYSYSHSIVLILLLSSFIESIRGKWTKKIRKNTCRY